MSKGNVDIVRRVFEAWAAGDWSIGRKHLDPHVVFVVRSDFPAFGAFFGIDQLRAYWQDFLAQWERTSFEATRLRAVGDTVVADVVQRAKGRTSGIEGELPFFMLFTFRGERIIRVESVMHEGEALEAVGLVQQR